MKRSSPAALALLLALSLLLSSCSLWQAPPSNEISFSLDEIPPWSDSPYVEINGNTPAFTSEEITRSSFEEYAPLDSLGRCGAAEASIGKDLMPTEERGSIGQVKPTGWHTVKYDHVDGKYLYNRCHLIGYQLSGENANPQNLITGTRYLNVEGMLPFENMVADYVKETSNHVMYRVVPVFHGEELLARGVTIEAYSVEDQGEGISFYVYCYNVQPGVILDYATGESRQGSLPSTSSPSQGEETFILNTNSKKIHRENCSSVKDIAPANKKEVTQSLSELEQEGYQTCKLCF